MPERYKHIRTTEGSVVSESFGSCFTYWHRCSAEAGVPTTGSLSVSGSTVASGAWETALADAPMPATLRQLYSSISSHRLSCVWLAFMILYQELQLPMRPSKSERGQVTRLCSCMPI